VGALWGMGHGVSATLLGITAFGIKRQFQNLSVFKFFNLASHITEIAVGLSLIVIGIMGLKEAQEWEHEIVAKNLSSAANDNGFAKVNKKNRAVVFNGLLHGFSWDGAPSLAPALAVATWGGNIAFLFSYALGTMTAMAAVTTFIGEGTRLSGKWFQRPDLPQKLSIGSSFLAIAIGLIWCGLAVLS
jgi:hypothetical protein